LVLQRRRKWQQLLSPSFEVGVTTKKRQ
jgi:hypothetical protein